MFKILQKPNKHICYPSKREACWMFGFRVNMQMKSTNTGWRLLCTCSESLCTHKHSKPLNLSKTNHFNHTTTTNTLQTPPFWLQVTLPPKTEPDTTHPTQHNSFSWNSEFWPVTCFLRGKKNQENVPSLLDIIGKLKQSKISHSGLRQEDLNLYKENRPVILYDERERKRDIEDRQWANEKGKD